MSLFNSFDMIMRIIVLKNVDNEGENGHSDKDDESSGDSEGENGESKKNSGDCGKQNVILIKIR